MTPEKEIFKRGDEEVAQNFSKLFVAMVKRERRVGRLSESLSFVGLQLEKDYMLMRKVKGAMMYPAIIFGGYGFDRYFYVYLCRADTGRHFQRVECGLASFPQAIIFISDFVTKHTYLFIIFSWLLFFPPAGF